MKVRTKNGATATLTKQSQSGPLVTYTLTNWCIGGYYIDASAGDCVGFPLGELPASAVSLDTCSNGVAVFDISDTVKLGSVTLYSDKAVSPTVAEIKSALAQLTVARWNTWDL